jgi:hypothetical protein
LTAVQAAESMNGVVNANDDGLGYGNLLAPKGSFAKNGLEISIFLVKVIEYAHFLSLQFEQWLLRHFLVVL